MDYSGALVTLLYQVNSGGGTTWATLASTTTNSNLTGNNYSIAAVIPPGVSYTCEIDVAIPLDFGDEAGGYENDIDAQGFSPVFTLSPGGEEVVGAALDSMNVNTLTDDPNGVIQQDKVTLRDAIKTGNNGPPFPAVTFDGTPSGTISLQKSLDPIKTSYNINGPSPTTLAVSGGGSFGIFAVNPGVTSTINGLTVEAGVGQNGNGGGILNSGNLMLNGVVVNDNEAAVGMADGGGIYNSSGAELILQTVVVSNNSAVLGGGGLYNAGAVWIKGGSVFESNTSSGLGGGIENKGGTIIATGNTQIIDNKDTWVGGGGVANSSGSFSMSGGAISNNKATGGAGGGAFNSGQMTISSVTLQGNQAATLGGGIYLVVGRLTLTKSTTVGFDLVGQPNKASNGGGLFIDAGTAVVSGAIENNSASTSGGGIYVSAGKLTLFGGAVNGNTAGLGGSIFMGGGTVKATSVSIYANQATFGSGGGIYVNAGSLTIKGNFLLTENKAPNGDGGGMKIAGGQVTLSGGSIEDNTTGGSGGGIYNSAGSLTIQNRVSVLSNTAKNQGGGLLLRIGSTTSFPGAGDNCMFFGNAAATANGVYREVLGANKAVINNWKTVSDFNDPNGEYVEGP